MSNLVTVNWEKVREWWGIPGGDVSIKITDRFRKAHRNVLLFSIAAIVLAFIDRAPDGAGEAVAANLKLPFLGADATIKLYLVGIFFLVSIAYHLWRFEVERFAVTAAQWAANESEAALFKKLEEIDKARETIGAFVQEAYSGVLDFQGKVSLISGFVMPTDRFQNAVKRARERLAGEAKKVREGQSFIDPDTQSAVFEMIDQAVFPVDEKELKRLISSASSQQEVLAIKLPRQFDEMKAMVENLLRMRTDLIGSQRRDFIIHWRLVAWLMGLGGIFASAHLIAIGL